MKNLKTKLLIIILAIIGTSATAQTFDLSPFYGWQMNGDIEYYEGELSVDGAPLVGGTLDVMLAEGYGIRLMYSYCKTNADFRSYDLTSYDDTQFNLINDYYQIGSIKSINTGGKAEPYGVFTLGAARFKGTNETQNVEESRWFFSMAVGLGCKIFFNDKIALKLEGAFMMPIYFQGVGMYFGTGGASMGVSGAVPLAQGNFNGGLVFRINK